MVSTLGDFHFRLDGGYDPRKVESHAVETQSKEEFILTLRVNVKTSNPQFQVKQKHLITSP